MNRPLIGGCRLLSKRTLLLAFAAGAILIVPAASASNSSRKTANAAPASPLFTPAGSNWAAAEGDPSNQRFSSLSQINTSNVNKLKVAWSIDNYPASGFTGIGVESTPLEMGGVLYSATPYGVDAINATTGSYVWKYVGVVPAAGASSGLSINTLAARTLSTGGGMIFAGQTDGSIVALNMKTGAAAWTAQVASVGTYGTATHSESNPFTIYYNGLVYAGVNGGESPIRGHLDAYNATTGALVWRWFTLPDPTNFPFILSWANPAEAATGGAAIWSIPAIDPKLNRIFFGTGNPYPYTGRSAGKNLWANSIVSLNASTGQLKWYYQTVHHDLWDYDCPTPVVLFNATVNGKTVPALAGSCKSGYIYELARSNGHPVFPIPETPVPNLDEGVGQALNGTWPTQPEPTGGAAQILPHCPTAAEAGPTLAGYPNGPDGKPYVLTCPYAPSDANQWVVWGPYFAFGGTDYPPMSFDPQTNDLYVCANVTYQATENASPTSTNQNYSTSGGDTAVGESGTVSALNVSTNKLAWQIKYQANQDGACYSGDLTTAGGLLFVSSRGISATGLPPGTPLGGHLYAYSAATGKQLWSYQNSSEIQAPAFTYSVNGTQYVGVDMEGNTSSITFPGFGVFTTVLSDKLTVFKLG
jgi:quinohemoprotein ethanol dehydrogenase